MTRESDPYRTIKVRKEAHYRLKVISLVKDMPITQVIDELLKRFTDDELFGISQEETKQKDPLN